MDKWTAIILEAEEYWKEIAATEGIGASCPDARTYSKLRDEYKAEFILKEYGYEYFDKFVKRCPHIQDSVKKMLICVDGEQCRLDCIYYEGGCKYATK